MNKFDLIRVHFTSDIQTQFEQWDDTFGIDISDVASNWIMVKFHSLPADLDELAKEIYTLCPNVIDQQFASAGLVVAVLTRDGQKLGALIGRI